MNNIGSNQFLHYDLREGYPDLNVPPHIRVPTTDDGAWEYFQDHRWVYNRLEVALSQNIICAPIGITPKTFPVFMKPLINLYGGGVGSKILTSPKDYQENKHLSGYLWMEYLQGEHLSHDLVIVKGERVFDVTFRGHSLGEGMFDNWETVKAPSVTEYVTSWAEENLSDYTGSVNCETIDGKIIECHLRMGDIKRIGNTKLLENILAVYAGEEWNFQDMLSPYYIFALWGDWNVDYSIDYQAVKEICQNLPFYVIDKLETYFQNPSSGVRLALTCSHSKEEALQARYELYEHFSPRPRKPIKFEKPKIEGD